MARNLPVTFRASAEGPHSKDAGLVFLTLSHASLPDDIRLVWDNTDYMLENDDGDLQRYIGFPFEIVLLSDTENAPQGRITVQNVDRAIGRAVRGLSDPPQVKIEIYIASDFDLSVVPRVPIGHPQLVYRALSLYFRNVTVDMFTASGELTSWDYSSQPWPSKLATTNILPGLFM